jgi:hypothetical protein
VAGNKTVAFRASADRHLRFGEAQARVYETNNGPLVNLLTIKREKSWPY